MKNIWNKYYITKDLGEITTKFHSDINQWTNKKTQPKIVFEHRELAAKVLMNCRTTAAHRFRTTSCYFDQRTISADKNKNFM